MAETLKLLLVGFGGPEKPTDIRPFIEGIVAGRSVPPLRIEQVASHYERLGGASPYNREARKIASGLRDALAARGCRLEVLLGMRHWHPWLADVISDETAAGTSRLIGVPMTPYGGAEAGERYRQAVESLLRASGRRAPVLEWVGPYHASEGFLEAWAARVRDCLPDEVATGSSWPWLLFTAHSVPSLDAEPYRSQVASAAEAVALAAGGPPGSWSLAWQSRSGRSQDPWLEPDILEEIRRLGREGIRSVLAVPIGFLCDHIEVLYDLGVEARAAAEAAGMAFRLAPTVGDHPLLIRALADKVMGRLT